MPFNPKCWASHTGPYAVNPDWFRGAFEAIRNGSWKASQGEDDYVPSELYVVRDGLALIEIQGPIMRGQSKFGGTSSLMVREALRRTGGDSAVNGILLLVDSPGGSVAGTGELAEEIRATAEKKPVYAHVEGMAASAAYWILAFASRITASPTSLVGNLGVYAVLTDSSKAADMQGLKVHVVASGALKGAGEPGTPVSQDLLAETQEIVDAMAKEFFDAVKAAVRAEKDATSCPRSSSKT